MKALYLMLALALILAFVTIGHEAWILTNAINAALAIRQ